MGRLVIYIYFNAYSISRCNSELVAKWYFLASKGFIIFPPSLSVQFHTRFLVLTISLSPCCLCCVSSLSECTNCEENYNEIKFHIVLRVGNPTAVRFLLWIWLDWQAMRVILQRTKISGQFLFFDSQALDSSACYLLFSTINGIVYRSRCSLTYSFSYCCNGLYGIWNL